jgi:putative inorganic carbon (hco3(-)) transporter
MLRTIFVLALLAAGGLLALRGPLEALLLYLWLAYFRPEQWVWGDAFQQVPISLIVGGYLALRAVTSGTRFRFDMRAVLLFGFLGLAILSGLASNYASSDTVERMLTVLAKAFVISYFIAIVPSDAAKLRLVVQAIALSLAFEGAKQGWAQIVLNPGGINNNGVPFLGDNNGVAVGMLMIVPMLIALGRTAVRKPERWLYWFLAVGVLYRAISTYSRGGFLAAGALGLVYALRSPKKFRALAGGAMAGLLIFSLLPESYWNRMDTIRVEDAEEQQDASAAGRIFFWRVAVRMAQAEPLGVGPDGFPDAYDRFDPSGGTYGSRRAVHSSWFGVLSEMGVLGLVLFLTILAMAWSTCIRAQFLAARDRIPKELGHFGAGFEGALAVFVVGGSFVTFQYIEMLWHLVGLTMCLNLNMESVRQQAPAKPVTLRAAV